METSAWKDHRMECKRLKATDLKEVPEIVRQIGRVIFKLKGIEKCQPKNSGDRQFSDLVSHKEDIMADTKHAEKHMEIYELLKKYIGPEKDLTLDSFFEIYGKVIINSVSALGYDQEHIALALYLNLSVLDHSCKPNCLMLFNGPKAIINSLRPDIKANTPLEYLTITYIQTIGTTVDRQRDLSKYYFTCECPWCLDTESDSIRLGLKCSDQMCDGVSIILGDHTKCLKCGIICHDEDKISKVMDSMTYVREQINIIMSTRREVGFIKYKTDQLLIRCDRDGLHRWNFYRVYLLNRMAWVAWQTGDYESAESYCRQTIDQHRKWCYQNDPKLGMHLFRWGTYLLRTFKFKEALPVLVESVTILDACYKGIAKDKIHDEAKSMLDRCFHYNSHSGCI